MKLLSRLFTALNLLPSMATLAFASRPILRHNSTNGYLNRVQSSRRLTGRLTPDHKTIADFRKDNGSAIKKVCAAGA